MPEIARLQVEAGAIGLTTATVWEAAAMARAGFDNILIANEVVRRGEAGVAGRHGAGDEHASWGWIDPEGAQALSAAVERAGSQIGVLVEIDIGLRRGGVRSDEDALRVAQTVSSLPGLVLRGAMGYEGWVVMEPDRRGTRPEGGASDRAAGGQGRTVGEGGLSHGDCFGGRHQYT